MKRKVTIVTLIAMTVTSLVGCTSVKESKFEDVAKAYEQFYIYDTKNNTQINLTNKDEKILTSEQATEILSKSINKDKTDRQKFLDAWEKLDEKQKSDVKMKEIQTEYKKIIEISQAVEANLKFYENVKNNADKLINDKELAVKLNNKNNTEVGSRGKAIKEYNELSKTGENEKNSIRVKYVREMYLDATNFLDVATYVGENKIEEAKTEMEKIKDEDLKKIAMEAVSGIIK